MEGKRSIADTLRFRRFGSKLLKMADNETERNIYHELLEYIKELSDRIDKLEERLEKNEEMQSQINDLFAYKLGLEKDDQDRTTDGPVEGNNGTDDSVVPVDGL